MIKKKSYERRVYESVDDNSLSKAISKKNDKKKNKSCNKGLTHSLLFSNRPIWKFCQLGWNDENRHSMIPSKYRLRFIGSKNLSSAIPNLSIVNRQLLVKTCRCYRPYKVSQFFPHLLRMWFWGMHALLTGEFPAPKIICS